MAGKFIVSGTGCALADNLYLNISFETPGFRKYLSGITGDGGLSPGRLVFTEELERFSGEKYPGILHNITRGLPFHSFNIGGPGLVPMIHAAQLLNTGDYEIRFYGVTGNDETAAQIFYLLKKTPLNIDEYQVGCEKPTPFTDVFSDPDYDNGHGERTFVNNIGAAWDYTPDKIPEDFFRSDLVCFGGTALVPRIHDGLTGLLRKAKDAGCITLVNTVYDFRSEKNNPGANWPLGNTDETFRLTDVLIMDKEEALKISGQPTLNKASDYFIAHNLKSFLITNGAEDITVYSDGSFFSKMPLSTFPVSAKVGEGSEKRGDTTGCGDNFVGGLVVSVAEQLKRNRQAQPDLKEALSWAVASGGFACFYVGGTWMENHRGEKRKKVSVFQKAYLQQLENMSINMGKISPMKG